MYTKAILKHAWHMHRKRVHNIQAEVDHASPLLQVSQTLQPHQLKVDAIYYTRMTNQNTELLRCINRVTRTQGTIDSFPKVKLTVSALHKRRIIIKRIKELDLRNELLGKRILHQKAILNTFPEPMKNMNQRQLKKVPKLAFEAPADILAKYDMTVIKLPRDCALQQRFLRPRIYVDLAIKNLRSLGRLIFELYTEASPQIVLEFIRICIASKLERLKVLRIFPGLWLEGELLADERTLTAKPLEYDMRALSHDSGAGVLSYSTRFLKGFRKGFINFSLSFKPLRVLQGRRVAFGRLVNGLKILDCMQDFGTKNGKLRREILVTGCGMHN